MLSNCILFFDDFCLFSACCTNILTSMFPSLRLWWVFLYASPSEYIFSSRPNCVHPLAFYGSGLPFIKPSRYFDIFVIRNNQHIFQFIKCNHLKLTLSHNNQKEKKEIVPISIFTALLNYYTKITILGKRIIDQVIKSYLIAYFKKLIIMIQRL